MLKPNKVVWMPAHTTEACIDVKRLSNGSVLTINDRKANDRADGQAKMAANASRVPPEARQDFDNYIQNVEDASIWLGLATWLSGNAQGPSKRDSGASALKAMQHRRMQEVLKLDRHKEPVVRLPSEGGHVLVSVGKQHWCALCGSKGPLHLVGRQRCSGAKRDRWLQKALEAKDLPQLSDDQSRGHLRMMSGQVVWCDRCGAYGTHRGCGLARPCPGQRRPSGPFA